MNMKGIVTGSGPSQAEQKNENRLAYNCLQLLCLVGLILYVTKHSLLGYPNLQISQEYLYGLFMRVQMLLHVTEKYVWNFKDGWVMGDG
jgi:hypothetical protein